MPSTLGPLADDLALLFVFSAARPVTIAPCPRHSHPFFELVIHPSGRGRTTVGNGQALQIAPGDAVLYPPREPHDQQLCEAGEDLIIQFECRGLAVDRTLTWSGRMQPRNLAIARLLVDHPAEGLANRRAAGHLILALLHQLDAGTTAAASTAGHAAQARRIISERYRDLGRLDEVAKVLGLSHDHLRHLFQAAYGISLIGWLTEVRLARARELLLRTPLTLAEIAAQVGWPNARYLCTVFRTSMGTSPARWRRQQDAPAKRPGR